MAPGGFITDVDVDSLRVVEAFIDTTCAGANVGTVFQLERTGYYCVDRDSTPELPIFNLTVGLKGGAATEGKTNKK